jgi:hypothetical protein
MGCRFKYMGLLDPEFHPGSVCNNQAAWLLSFSCTYCALPGNDYGSN